jgi:hypothetical protein
MQRAASLVIGLWLAIFAAEPVAMHACPIHDVGHQQAHSSHHAPQQKHNCCTCPGACCPGVNVQLATAPTIEGPRVVAVAVPNVFIATIGESGDVQVALPPAVGPPTISG